MKLSETYIDLIDDIKDTLENVLTFGDNARYQVDSALENLIELKQWIKIDEDK